jgi:hypothetical protein
MHEPFVSVEEIARRQATEAVLPLYEEYLRLPDYEQDAAEIHLPKGWIGRWHRGWTGPATCFGIRCIEVDGLTEPKLFRPTLAAILWSDTPQAR